jgi:hypothetical protein
MHHVLDALGLRARNIKPNGEHEAGENAVAFARLIYAASNEISFPRLYHAFHRLTGPLDRLSLVILFGGPRGGVWATALGRRCGRERQAVVSQRIPVEVKAATNALGAASAPRGVLVTARRSSEDSWEAWLKSLAGLRQLVCGATDARNAKLVEFADVAPRVGCRCLGQVAILLAGDFGVLFAEPELSASEYELLWPLVLSIRAGLPERVDDVSVDMWRMLDDILAWLSRKRVRMEAGLDELLPHLARSSSA